MADKDITDTDSKEPETIYTYYEKVYADPADTIFWYGFGQGIMQFFTGSNTSLGVYMSDEFCHTWDYITGQYELVLHSEALPDDEGKEESEYNSRSRSRKRSIVIPDNAEYTPVTRTEYELTYYVNNVNTNNTQVLMEYDENGTLKNSYTYGNERISIDSEEEKDYYLYDGRGSVSQVVNADEIVEAYTYDPFGNVTSGAPDFESFYGYNAEETNPVTGLQYLRARYYDSATGRFSTADSYLGDVTNPLTLNRYIYTLNNPVMYNDPSGHFVGTALLIAAAVAAGVGIAVGLSGCANTKTDTKTVVNDELPTEIKERDVTAPKYISSASKLKSGNEIEKEFVNNVANTSGKISNDIKSIDEEIKAYYTGNTKPENGKRTEEVVAELNEQREKLCESIDKYNRIVIQYNETHPNNAVEIAEISESVNLSFLDRFSYDWQYHDERDSVSNTVTLEFLEKVVEISDKLGVNPDDLMAVMAFESWIDPHMVNSWGATGLIQFTNIGVSDLNVTVDELYQMTAVDQLDYVYSYLCKKGELNTLGDLYMAILWPEGVGKDEEKYVVWNVNNVKEKDYYDRNKGLDTDCDGLITKKEATQTVIARRNTFNKKEDNY